MIIKDEPLLNTFRLLSHCEWCLRPRKGQLEANHVTFRGHGGGNRLDIRVNLVGMCFECHGAYHDGQIKRRELLELVANRERTTVAEIMAEIYRLRRAPKRNKS